MRILIIDDEVRRMQATVDMLRSDHYIIEQITNPSVALQKLRTSPTQFDLIILDVMMPIDNDDEFKEHETNYGLRTGFLLLSKIKQITGFTAPIIVLTANYEIEEELKGKVGYFLRKPVPYAQLKAAIDKLRTIEGKLT